MVSLAQGRVIAETDQERLALEIRRFDAQVAAEFLKLLSDFVIHRRDGFIQVQVIFKDGAISRKAIVTNCSKDLDEHRSE